MSCLSLQAIARALGGTISGSEVRAPTPGHSKADRGTSVRIVPGAPDGLLVSVFNGGLAEALQVKDTLRAAGILPDFDGRRRELTEAEKTSIRRAERARKAELLSQNQKAASTALHRIGEARAADPCHPYLARKRISSECLYQTGDLLLVPMYDTEGRLWNVQSIDPNGSKRFQKGGRTKGVFWSAGVLTKTAHVVIGEGMATVAAIRRATGLTVVAAMSAHNLITVGLAIRSIHPDIRITVAADDDVTGRDAACRAARLIGADIAFPEAPHGN